MDKIKFTMEAKTYGSFDVIVCGGGTAGVVAALAAAREGANTLLMESSNALGGMLTTGNAGLTKYVLHGSDPDHQYEIDKELGVNPENVLVAGGIPLELTNRMIKEGMALGNYGTGMHYVYPDVHQFKQFLFEELQKAGVRILLHCKAIEVVKTGDKVDGVIFDSKAGPLVAYGKYIIDATGDGDVAVLAGAEYTIGTTKEDCAVKEGLVEEGKIHNPGSMFRVGGVDFDKFVAFIKANPDRFTPHMFGLMKLEEFIEEYEKGDAIETFIKLKDEQGEYKRRFQVYNNPREQVMVGCISCKTGLNCLDVDEYTLAEYQAMDAATRQLQHIKREIDGFENAFIIDVPLGVRETRHIQGEHLMTIEDIVNNVDYEDTIGISSHPIDTHPRPSFMENMKAPDRAWFRVPYRSTVVKGFDNLYVAGRQISATHEAFGCIRPTICCMVIGEAVGTAAAMLTKNGKGEKAKDIDVKSLQAKLKENGVKIR